MFLGHFALGFAAKTACPRVSLGTLFLASQFIDLLWATLLLVGIEQVVIAPGITSVTVIDFTHYPFSHSFAAVVGWGLLIAGGYWLGRRSKRGAAVLGGVVVSHWILDLVVHRADLPLFPGSFFSEFPGHMKHFGLGLWHSLPATVLVEGLLFAGGVFLYVSATKATNRAGRCGFWALVAVLIGSYGAMLAGPPPPSVAAIGWAGQLQWLLVGWAYWMDAQRGARRAPSFTRSLRRTDLLRHRVLASASGSRENGVEGRLNGQGRSNQSADTLSQRDRSV